MTRLLKTPIAGPWPAIVGHGPQPRCRASSADLAGTSSAAQRSARRLCLVVACGPYCLGGGGGALLAGTQIGAVEPRYLRTNGRAASSVIGEGHRRQACSLLRHAGLAQTGEIGGFVHFADLRHPP